MCWNISISSFLDGYYMVCLGVLPVDTIKMMYHTNADSSIVAALVNGVNPIGSLFGALLTSLFIHRFSRRTYLLMTDAIGIAVALLILVPNFYSLVFFRFLQGVNSGFTRVITPIIVK